MSLLNLCFHTGSYFKDHAKVPLSIILKLNEALDCHDPVFKSAFIRGAHHLAFIDPIYEDRSFQFIFNLTSSQNILGIPNIDYSFFPSSLQLYNNSPFYYPNRSFLSFSLNDRYLIRDKRMSMVQYSCGLSNEYEFKKIYYTAVNYHRINFLEYTINNILCNMILNTRKKSFLMSWDKCLSYVDRDQYSYIFPDMYELKHLGNEKDTLLGLIQVKNLFYSGNMYNINKYGIEGLKRNSITINDSGIDIDFDNSGWDI